MTQTTYTVCFANDTNEYIMKHYKTFGGAKRYIDANRWLYANYRNLNQWAIERIMPREEWGQTCVIAQSVNYVHKPRFRNRSDADRWEKGQGE